MLVEQINRLNFEPLERTFDGLFDMFRPAVQARRAGPIVTAAQVEPELRRNDQLLAERRERIAHEFLVGERAIDLGGVEKRDAAIHGGVEQGGHFLFVLGRPIGKTHAHAAQPDGRDFQIAVTEFALLHI
jgi:hypothetical protein